MSEYFVPGGTTSTWYFISNGNYLNNGITFNSDGVFTDNTPSDNMLSTSEAVEYVVPGTSTMQSSDFVGRVTIEGVEYPVFVRGTFNAVIGVDLDSATYPTFASLGVLDTSDFTVAFCFAAGTQISTATGTCAIEHLNPGDLVQTADGRSAPVKWVGRQTLSRFTAGHHMQPVRIRAGALGHQVPERDLIVTADHGMLIGAHLINASALVNGESIDWVPMEELGDRFTVYNIETEQHDVILANGAPAETFNDAAGRAAFDNYQEYLDLYGTERLIPQMPMPRISSARLIPAALRDVRTGQHMTSLAKTA